jgi:predicted unusual protein kinase regulating ubiquinone biosynthesis (AarF/ABC1/UbiB family)
VSDLPRRTVSRTAKLAALPLGIAGRAAWGLGKRVGGKSAEAVAAEIQARTADQIYRTLGELKGGAMKFGQALSILEASLPDDVAAPMRSTLAKLQNAAPPMSATTVHRVLADEFGEGWRDRFSDFDDRPAAAASIGQVHRAVWHDGRSVAVKVQYPGAADALLSDLQTVSRMGRVAGGWIPGLDIGPLLDELRDRMSEELDYTREARNQQAFADALARSDMFAVPAVLESTDRVVVSDWLDGRGLGDVIESGTQDERDLVSHRYIEFLLAGPARAGLLHADPHPGNYLLMPDGRLGVVDFGAVKELPDGMPSSIGTLLRIALDGDGDAVVEGLRGEGFIRDGIRIDGDELLAYLGPFMKFAEVDRFRFTRDWVRDLFTHVKDPRRAEWTVGLRLNLPREYLLIHRVWLGGVGVLCQIGGEVPVLEVFDEWLPGFERDPAPEPQPA